MKKTILISLVYALLSLAHAGGTDIDQVTDVTTDVSTDVSVLGGDTTAGGASVGNSRAYGFSHGLGDVDINQCLASTQWGTIIVSRQKVVLNKWCAAEVYDAKGLHDMAARVRCDIPEVGKHFETLQECRAANTAFIAVPEPATPKEDDDEDEHAEDISALYSRIQNLEAATATAKAEAKTARAEALKASRSAQRAQQEAQEVVAQAPIDSFEQRRLKSKAALEGK